MLRSAVGGALAIVNARKPRIRSRVLTIPSFFSGWITTEAAGLLLLRRAVHVVRAWRLGRYRTTQGKVALALDAAVGRIEQRLMKWQPRTGETEKLGAHRPAMLYEFTRREPMVL